MIIKMFLLSLPSHVIHAAKNPINLDDRQVDAVNVRIELDLRIGYAFTRFQTNNLRMLGGDLSDKMISFGKGSSICKLEINIY